MILSEKQQQDLSINFPKWSFTGSTVLIASAESNTTARNEIPELIDTLLQCCPNKRLSFNINEGNMLQVKVDLAKTTKYTRMYTSGCFDIFHYGHLNILRKSKAMCDFLIVGVSTDELIEKEKGMRPMIPFEERMRVIESIQYVDKVIPQIDKNKQKIVDEYQIDAISVGDDWKGRYPKVSCAMEYFSYTKNVSSTLLKDTLQVIEKQND